MPETRYVEVSDGQGNVVDLEPYEVSDEELQEEADLATAQGYLASSPDVISQPEMWFLIRYLARRIGITL